MMHYLPNGPAAGAVGFVEIASTQLFDHFFQFFWKPVKSLDVFTGVLKRITTAIFKLSNGVAAIILFFHALNC